VLFQGRAAVGAGASLDPWSCRERLPSLGSTSPSGALPLGGLPLEVPPLGGGLPWAPGPWGGGGG